jgi:hypothetical protein
LLEAETELPRALLENPGGFARPSNVFSTGARAGMEGSRQ